MKFTPQKWTLAAVALAAVSSAACTKKSEEKPKQEAAAGGAPKSAGGPGAGGRGPVPVRVAIAEKKISPRIVQTVAALSGRTQVDVYSKVTGRVTYMGPREGQPVKSGEILFRIDRNDPGESYLNVPVVSPLTGWLGRWRVLNMGEQVGPTDPVVTIVDDRTLKAAAFLPASDWVEVTPDTKVTLQVNDEVREGKVETIARAADLSSGRGSVTVVVENGERRWRGGMYARLTFSIAPKERLLLNAASLTVTDQGSFVYVIEGDVAKRVPIKFQLIDADTIEVTDGLQPQSQVVIAGGNLLSNNSPVRIIGADDKKSKKGG